MEEEPVATFFEVCEPFMDSPHVDYLVEMSKGNRTVRIVYLHPYGRGDHYASWVRVGEALGNLDALEEIVVRFHSNERGAADWHTLSCALSRLKHKIYLRFCNINIRRWSRAQ